MGYRLYVLKQYKIEYSTGYFNNMSKEIKELIIDIFSDIYLDEEKNIIEIPKQSYIKDIEKIKYLIYEKYLEKIPYTVDELYSIFKEILDISDPENNFIRLEWF